MSSWSSHKHMVFSQNVRHSNELWAVSVSFTEMWLAGVKEAWLNTCPHTCSLQRSGRTRLGRVTQQTWLCFLMLPPFWKALKRIWFWENEMPGVELHDLLCWVFRRFYQRQQWHWGNDRGDKKNTEAIIFGRWWQTMRAWTHSKRSTASQGWAQRTLSQLF